MTGGLATAEGQPQPAPSGGMSTTTRNLGIVSIVVVVLLFACCVILAYTSEIRFSPSTD